MKNLTHYQELGLSVDADEEQIKNAYRLAAKRHHPDNGGTAAKFQAATEAYEVLVDPARRAEYDRLQNLRGSGQPQPPADPATAQTADPAAEPSGPSSPPRRRSEPLRTPLTHPRVRPSYRPQAPRGFLGLFRLEWFRLTLSCVAVSFGYWQYKDPMTLWVASLGYITVLGGWGYLEVFMLSFIGCLAVWLIAVINSRYKASRVARLVSSWLVLAASLPGLLGLAAVLANASLIIAGLGLAYALLGGIFGGDSNKS